MIPAHLLDDLILIEVESISKCRRTFSESIFRYILLDTFNWTFCVYFSLSYA